MTKPLVFISYSAEDEDLKDQLLSHLEVLGKAGLVEVWSADRIGAGLEWRAEIDQTISQAKVALLLVTANFLNSDFILDEEVPLLLQRREQEGLVVLPVIAKACAWHRVDWLARLVGDPQRVKPIWRGPDSHVDEALSLIADYVAKIVASETPLSTADWPETLEGIGQATVERAAGDAVAGDKVLGDKVEGDKVEGDKILGDKILGDKRNVLQIGTLTVPLLPLLIAAVSLVAVLGFVSYRTFSPAALPTPTPAQNSLFNVLVAAVGKLDANGQLQPSEEGQQISERIFEALQLEFENLPVAVRQDFLPAVWHDRLRPLPEDQQIGLIADEAAAAEVAEATGADMVIYGTMQTSGDATRFTPQFYVASLRGEADGVVGGDRFGEPIELGGGSTALNLNKKLNNRTRALSRFTLGLMYDLNGFHRDALAIFEQALETLDFTGTGAEPLFQYFVGRSNLFLEQDETALTHFQSALDEGYARGHIGVGSVHFFRAQAITPTYRLETDELEQAISHYQAALNDNSLSSSLRAAARLGLGMTYRLKGESHFARGEDEEANRWFDLAIQELEAALEPLQATDQHRYLGQAYLSLGAAYTQQARVRQDQGDRTASIALYEKANEAYGHCIDQKTQTRFVDDTLNERIIAAGCEPFKAISEEALAALKGE